MLIPRSLKQFSYVYTLCIVGLLISACDKTKHPVNSLEIAVKGAHSGAISTNGQLAMIGSIHHGASLWDVTKKARVFSWNHQADSMVTATSCALTHDSTLALTVEQYTLVLWDTKTGKGIRHWRAPAKVLDAQLSDTGRYALLGLESNQAVLFDIQNGGITYELNHTNQVTSVSLERSGRLALTGSDDNTAIIWDLTTGQKKQTLKHDDNVKLAVLSPNGTRAFTMSQYDQATLWDTKTGEKLGGLPLKAERLKRGLRYTSATFNNDNSLLLTGRPDQIVELWETSTMTKLDRWALPKRSKWKPTGASVQAVQFISNTQFIALASNGFMHTLER